MEWKSCWIFPKLLKSLERETGVEPATSSLGKRSNFVSRSVPSFLSITEVHAVATVSAILARMESERSQIG